MRVDGDLDRLHGALPALTAGEGLRARAALAGGQRGAAELGFARGRRVPVEAPLAQRREPVVAQAGLREGRELRRQLQRRRQRLALRRQPVDEADLKRLARAHRPAGEDQVHGPRGADQARQAHRARSIATQRRQTHRTPRLHPPPACCPQGHLQAAGHRIALDGGDHRFEAEPRQAMGP